MRVEGDKEEAGLDNDRLSDINGGIYYFLGTHTNPVIK